MAIELAGSFVTGLGVEDRLVLANQGIELGAKNAIVVPDPSFVEDYGVGGAIAPGADASYARRVSLAVADLSPLVARPGSPDDVASAEELASDVHSEFDSARLTPSGITGLSIGDLCCAESRLVGLVKGIQGVVYVASHPMESL